MPFQRLFTRRSVRTFYNQTKESLTEKTAAFWRQNQFQVSFPQQYYMHGEQYFSKIGLRRVVDVWFYDQGEDVAVDLSFSATLGDAEAAVGLIGAVILLPVTAVVGAVSYLDYANDADHLIDLFWRYMGPFTTAVPAPAPPHPAAPSQPAVSCRDCGSTLDPDSQFCKRCGARVDHPPGT